MTHNQINYWNLKETSRHNVVSEKETNRHNVTTEVETERHNRAGEFIDLGKLNESIRHNKATEGIESGKLAETTRHNQASETIDLGKLNESVRHNMASEQLSQSNIDLGYANVGLGYANVGLGYSNLAELGRHNITLEDLEQQRVSSTQMVNSANADYTRLKGEWEALLNNSQLNINKATERKINAQVDEIGANINNLQASSAYTNKKVQYYEYEMILKQITDAANSMGNIMKGLRYGTK